MTEPEQWAADFAKTLDDAGILYGPASVDIAAKYAQHAFEERERKLRGALQERDILIAELIAKAAIAVAIGGDAMWQRFNDEAIAARQALKEPHP